jgi:1-aminocyclopropane-1-carboxylate deaminase/D-cysteine desulfhydrase-like pyridoxal-dependent ACC family enzyme
VRITNNATSHVFYARTHDHSTMGVATGNKSVSTNFDVPSGMETGASSLVVVANGIPSNSVSVTVQ